MAKLNQILAIEKGAKEKVHRYLTQVHHGFQNSALFQGLTRDYRPLDDEGERFPSERQNIQARGHEELKKVGQVMIDYFDLVAAKDYANMKATADVVVDDQKILEGVPATHLLWLEKRLVDLHTLVDKLPELPAGENWTFDETTNAYRSEEHETSKTKKVPKPFVKYEATKEHPAQVEVVHEDVLQGYWKTVKFSGAFPSKRIAELRERIEKLQRAVKYAREQANLQEVERQETGEKVFGYLFA